MNLKNKTIYLSGPIAGCSDGECRIWRDEFTRKWPGQVLNPMRHDHRLMSTMTDSLAYSIVTQDVADIHHCDGVVVYIDRPSVGTSMEMVYARRTEVPIIVIDARPNKEPPISPWIWYHSTEIVDTLDAAIRHLSLLLKDKR